jgi:choline dehydrogenase-like flavoprotein
MARPKVDAVIVGAGAAGPIVAKELAVAGYHVVLLERGKFYTAWDCRKDDLRNQRTSLLGNAFGPDDDGNPRVIVGLDGKARVIAPSEPGYNNNAACVGGGTVSYGAMAWRFHPLDFRMKSQYGAVAGSTLDDWPISYDDLEPYYDKAEYEVGVSGDGSNNPHQGPRKRPLPMPPLPPTREHLLLEKAARAKGWHPFDIPMLRNSVPRDGRPACMRCRWCVGFACEVDAKCGTQNTVLRTALATGNCELRTDAMTREIMVDARGRATGVRYHNAEGQLEEQPASVVVVSASAVETPRLLLNSRSANWPQGIGNRYDWVGRNLQGHTYTGAVGLFDFDIYDDVGPGAGVAISDFNHGNPGLTGGAMLANEFIRLPIQFIGIRAPGVPRWGKAYKDWVRRYYRRSVMIQGPTQEMPLFESRVTVDAEVKDKYGIPVARISGDRHKHTLEISLAMAKHAQEWLLAAGAANAFLKTAGPGVSGGQHQAGTCRMGNDPKTSVVDRSYRVHESENIYVVDGSVHVTNGGFNPVLTIMANAYRAGEIIARELKGGRG